MRITGNVEVLCHVQVAEEIWNKEKIPKASLCCGNVNKGFKIQKENRVEGEDGGWAVKRYNEILENIETMVNVMMTDSDDDEGDQNKDVDHLPGETSMNCLKRKLTNYISAGNPNNFKRASEWLKITGLCGFKNKTVHHHMMMTYLVKHGFLERSEDNKLRLEKWK